jgi:hypothetical protein
MGSKRPHYRQAHLLAAPSGEAAAARALQQERERRGQACFVELMALLERHRCTLQVIVQDIQTVGQGAVSRMTQVNVLPLDVAPAPVPAGESLGNGAEPAG